MDYITDTTEYKQGKFTPGSHIPIVSPDILNSEIPDYALILPWNYADWIIKKEARLLDKGVKFIVAVPELSVIEAPELVPVG